MKPLAKWALWVLRLLVGGLFLYSGAVKVWDVPTFAQAIHGYRLLPAVAVPFLAQVLPWLEIWCALALWFAPILRRASWIWINLLLAVFTVAKISALQRGLDISCGCTHSAVPMTWMSVAENVFWMALSLPALCWDRDRTTPTHYVHKSGSMRSISSIASSKTSS